MICKNCGAKLSEDSFVCPKCGYDNADKGFVLDTENDGSVNREKNGPNVEKIKNIISFIIAVVVIIAVAIGSYKYFYDKNNQKVAPAESFTCGTGIINGDQRVIYVTIEDPSLIKYINGARIYDHDITQEVLNKAEPVTSNYEYTKSVDESYRCVFFYADELGIEQGKDYTYTIEVDLAFTNDERVWSYPTVVTFNGNIDSDASAIVFDHSMQEDPLDIL